MVTRLDWTAIATADADRLDGTDVEIIGFMAAAEPDDSHDYFLLLAEPVCCIGCWPNDPWPWSRCSPPRRWRPRGGRCGWPGAGAVLVDDPAGWRYQLRDAG